MTSSTFPDINVWLALAYSHHGHHRVARHWYDSLSSHEELIFCRHTQMGLLRLLTRSAIMGEDVKSQIEAWHIYDSMFIGSAIRFLEEPRGLDEPFRQLARSSQATPQDWADSYLAAFAKQSSLRLVTFDKALHGRVRGSLLLAAL